MNTKIATLTVGSQLQIKKDFFGLCQLKLKYTYLQVVKISFHPHIFMTFELTNLK